MVLNLESDKNTHLREKRVIFFYFFENFYEEIWFWIIKERDYPTNPPLKPATKKQNWSADKADKSEDFVSFILFSWFWGCASVLVPWQTQESNKITILSGDQDFVSLILFSWLWECPAVGTNGGHEILSGDQEAICLPSSYDQFEPAVCTNLVEHRPKYLAPFARDYSLKTFWLVPALLSGSASDWFNQLLGWKNFKIKNTYRILAKNFVSFSFRVPFLHAQKKLLSVEISKKNSSLKFRTTNSIQNCPLTRSTTTCKTNLFPRCRIFRRYEFTSLCLHVFLGHNRKFNPDQVIFL